MAATVLGNSTFTKNGQLTMYSGPEPAKHSNMTSSFF